MLNRSLNAGKVRLSLVVAAAALLALVVAASGVFAQDTSIEYEENGTEPVARFAATDADGDAIVWDLTGDDEDDFEITDGVLTFEAPPDFEEPTDDRNDNVYEVTVTASGGS